MHDYGDHVYNPDEEEEEDYSAMNKTKYTHTKIVRGNSFNKDSRLEEPGLAEVGVVCLRRRNDVDEEVVSEYLTPYRHAVVRELLRRPPESAEVVRSAHDVPDVHVRVHELHAAVAKQDKRKC